MRVVALLLLLQETQPQTPVEIQPLSGEVQVLRPKAKKPEKAAGKVVVQPEDRLGTATGVVSRIAIDADVVLILKGVEAKENGGLSAAHVGKKLVLKLYKGSAVVESVETDVSVETPHGKVEGKTVYFLLEVQPDKSRIVAVDGTLAFTTTLGKLTLEGGETVTADGKKPPVKGTMTETDRVSTTSGEAAVNLIQNPGFEEDLTEWIGALAKVDDKPLSGKKCARVEVAPGKYLLWQGHYGILTAGTRYMFRTWVRADQEGTITLTFNWSVKDQAFKGDFRRTVPVTPGAWKCVRFFVTPQADGYELTIDPGTVKGTLRFDDFLLAPLPDPAKK
jgi:hypothetical protein